MSWHPGLPVITESDHAAWRAWRKSRKLEQQRERRQRYPRIDYYPSEEALAVIDAARAALPSANGPGSDNSSLIDALVLAGAKKRHV